VIEGREEKYDYGMDFLFYGFVTGDEPELGYFTLSKLERITEAYGLQLDETFQPTRLSEVKKIHEPWLYE